MESQRSPSVALRAFGQTDPGLVRSKNEDIFVLANLTAGQRLSQPGLANWAVGERGVLLAVSDGMGGAAAGEVASALSLEALFRGLSEGAREGEDDAARLQRVVQRASQQVREAARRSERRGMGATLTAVFICGHTAYIAEVGDSRAYLIRKGRICQVTHDQSYVQLLVDAGVLTPEQAESSPQKNIILQVMGQKEELVVELGRLELRKGDRLLLCSDGLSNAVSDEDIRRLAASPSPVDAACTALIQAANRAGGKDNITVILAEVTGHGLPAASEDEACDESVEVVQEFKPH